MKCKMNFCTFFISFCCILLLCCKNKKIESTIVDNTQYTTKKPIIKMKIKRILNKNTCDSFYLKHRRYFDTSMSFEDGDIRKKLFPLIKEIYPNANDNDAILDIGGNLGDIIHMMKILYPSIKIYTAEPVPKYYKHLLNRFRGDKNINIYNLAIGSSKEDKIIKYDKWHHMMIVNRRLYEREIAHFMKLDDFYKNYVKNKNILFLKIDVEGFEDEVLFTGRNLLKNISVKIIYYEYHGSIGIRCKTKNSDLIHYLESLGYNCYGLGKYKIIRLSEKCLKKYDQHIYPHTIAIKDDIEKEELFINTYNNKYKMK